MILAKRLMMCLLKAGWSEWILNPTVTVNTNGIAHYTAYKTNQREYYDSYANLDLTEAIVQSLHDADMQQWQAVKDAIANLIGSGVGYEWDNINRRIGYVEVKPLEACAPDGSNCTDSPYLYRSDWRCQINYEPIYAKSVDELAELTAARYKKYYLDNTGNGFGYAAGEVGQDFFTLNSTNGSSYCPVRHDNNPQYAQAITPTLYKSFIEIAQKIISNASSSNQAISLLAETYIEAVANSIFNADESKQFVKLSDLIDQFEENKVLRI